MQLPNKNFLSAKLQNLTNSHFQYGFTLLEMVLVLFLIGLLASAGLLFTEGVEDQAKYDETKRRMELIRKAIIGDATRTINGAPEVSGFAADMGRLPECIREVIVSEKCDGTSQDPWAIDPDTGFGYGWRGPYIQTIADRKGEFRFRDGYNNDDDTENFGWHFTVAASSVQLQSEGFDIVSELDNFPQPISSVIPSLIVKNDWLVTLPNAINVNIKNQSTNSLPVTALTEKLLLRIYHSDLSDFDDANNGSGLPVTLTQSSVPATGIKTKTFELDDSKEIPLGNRAYALICFEADPVDPNDFVIFDGDCDSASNSKPNSSNIRTFSVVPRNSLNLQLDWIIPTP